LNALKDVCAGGVLSTPANETEAPESPEEAPAE
jgi:hypothetical protein